MGNEKGRRMIHLIAGGYLIYLAWQMLQSRSELSGTPLIVTTLAMIAFTAIGAALIVFAIRALMKMASEIESEPEESGSEEPRTEELRPEEMESDKSGSPEVAVEEETVKDGMTIRERASQDS